MIAEGDSIEREEEEEEEEEEDLDDISRTDADAAEGEDYKPRSTQPVLLHACLIMHMLACSFVQI